MTPHQLANWICANADENGCAGLGIDDKLQTFRLWPRKNRCDVDTKRCIYFEGCVARQVLTLDEGKVRDSYLAAIELYLRRLSDSRERLTAKRTIFGEAPDSRKESLPVSRKCPDCQEPLEARQRYCAKCMKRRRRETFRHGNLKRGV